MKKLKNNSTFITRGASLVTIAVALFVLATWIFDFAFVKNIFPDYSSMKFNTAVCFILAAIILYLISDENPLHQKRKKIAFIFSWVLLVIGLLNLLQYIYGWNLGIDELLWKEGPGANATFIPGRMSRMTA